MAKEQKGEVFEMNFNQANIKEMISGAIKHGGYSKEELEKDFEFICSDRSIKTDVEIFGIEVRIDPEAPKDKIYLMRKLRN